MSANLEIILRVKDDGSVTLQKTATGLRDVQKAADEADAGLKRAGTSARSFSKEAFARDMVGQFQQIPGVIDKTADSIDRVGTRARIGLSAASQAAQLLRVDLSAVVGPAASAADAVGDLAGTAAALGPVGIGIGALVVGFGVLNSVMAEQNRHLAEAILKTDAWVESIRQAAGASAQVTQTLRDMAEAQARAQTGWSWEIGDVVNRWMQFDNVGRGVAEMFNLLSTSASDLHPALETSAEKAARLRDELNAMYGPATQAYNALEDLRASSDHAATSAYAHARAEEARQLALDYSAAAARRLADAMGDTRREVIEGRREEAHSLAEYNTQLAWGNKEFKEGVGWVEKVDAAQKRLADTIQQRAIAAWNQLRQTIRGLVENALQPTSVTMDDLNAALAGKYIPKWDEFRRRVEAIATGTNIDQFGAKFKAQLEMVQAMFKDLNLEQIASKFKDFSLFADMDMSGIKQLIDFGPIQEQVSQQVDAIIGKAKVMKAAFDDVWASLSTSKKIDLANALGLDASAINVEGLKNQIQGAVTGATTGIGDAATKALNTGLENATTNAGGLATKLSTALSPAFGTLKSDVDTLALPALTSMSDYITKTAHPALTLVDDKLKTINTSLADIKPALEDDQAAFDALVLQIPGYETTFKSLIENALAPLHNALAGIVADLLEIIAQANNAAAALAKVNGGSGTASTTPPPPTNPPPGFARGGTFRVEGLPGTDTNLVRFRATRGEMVTVTPPGQRRGASNQFTFDFRNANFAGADAGIVNELVAAMSEMFDRKLSHLAQGALNLDALTGN